MAHWSGEILTARKDIGEKSVVVGSLGNTNTEGDGKRKLKRKGQKKRRKSSVSPESKGRIFKKIKVNTAKILPIRYWFWQIGH